MLVVLASALLRVRFVGVVGGFETISRVPPAWDDSDVAVDKRGEGGASSGAVGGLGDKCPKSSSSAVEVV